MLQIRDRILDIGQHSKMLKATLLAETQIRHVHHFVGMTVIYDIDCFFQIYERALNIGQQTELFKALLLGRD